MIFKFQINKIKMIIILTLSYRMRLSIIQRFPFYLCLLINKVILYGQYLLYLPKYPLISQFIQQISHQSSKYNVKKFRLVIYNDNLDHWTVLSNIRIFYVYVIV
jgi:hypothetical protein